MCAMNRDDFSKNLNFWPWNYFLHKVFIVWFFESASCNDCSWNVSLCNGFSRLVYARAVRVQSLLSCIMDIYNCPFRFPAQANQGAINLRASNKRSWIYFRQALLTKDCTGKCSKGVMEKRESRKSLSETISEKSNFNAKKSIMHFHDIFACVSFWSNAMSNLNLYVY